MLTHSDTPPSPPRVFVGFDGFVDTIIHPVHKRFDPHTWSRIDTIVQFSERIRASSNKSTNIECVDLATMMGGNAPLMAQALAATGSSIELVGTLNQSPLTSDIDPVFLPLLRRENVQSYSIGCAGKTDAFEFHDGKILFGHMRGVHDIHLHDLFQRCSEEKIGSLLSLCDAIATVNWTMMPLVGEFWTWLAARAAHHPEKDNTTFPWLFIDFADPKKRPLPEFQASFRSILSCAQHGYRVIISLNFSEAQQTLTALGEELPSHASIASIAESVYYALPGIKAVVCHSHKEVAVFYLSQNGHPKLCKLQVPYEETPIATTGAGDSFNGGFLSAIVHGHSMKTALAWATATSGIWVRKREPASVADISSFIEKYSLLQ